jgi:hypothetical protein
LGTAEAIRVWKEREGAEFGPVQGDQGRLLTLAGQAADDGRQDAGGVGPVVGAEAPGALDAVLGGGHAGQTTARGREGAAAAVAGGFDQVGEGVGLAEAQAGG